MYADIVIIIMLHLFNNIFSCVGYAVLNVGTVNKSWIGKDVGGSAFAFALWNCWNMWETLKNISQDGQSLDRVLNLGHPECSKSANHSTWHLLRINVAVFLILMDCYGFVEIV